MYKNIHYLKWRRADEILREKGLVIFSLQDFTQSFGLNKNTAVHYLSRHTKEGDIVRLKKGVYAIASPRPNLYLLANKLYEPSYVSLESGLSYYSLIPEVIYTVTSVTTKPTREFTAFDMRFTYKTIKKEAFTGYQLVKAGEDNVYMADEEKAVMDYLYFVSLGDKRLRERMDVSKLDKKKLVEYAALFNRSSLLNLIKGL